MLSCYVFTAWMSLSGVSITIEIKGSPPAVVLINYTLMLLVTYFVYTKKLKNDCNTIAVIKEQVVSVLGLPENFHSR